MTPIFIFVFKLLWENNIQLGLAIDQVLFPYFILLFSRIILKIVKEND
jgi:hypothetical protein